MHIQSVGCASYHLVLVMGQFFHIWTCRTRTIPILQHGLTNNVQVFYGVAIEFFLIIIFVYVPGVQTIMGSETVSWVPWVTSFILGFLLIGFSEGKKYYFQKYPDSPTLRKIFAW